MALRCGICLTEEGEDQDNYSYPLTPRALKVWLIEIIMTVGWQPLLDHQIQDSECIQPRIILRIGSFYANKINALEKYVESKAFLHILTGQWTSRTSINRNAGASNGWTMGLLTRLTVRILAPPQGWSFSSNSSLTKSNQTSLLPFRPCIPYGYTWCKSKHRRPDDQVLVFLNVWKGVVRGRHEQASFPSIIPYCKIDFCPVSGVRDYKNIT